MNMYVHRQMCRKTPEQVVENKGFKALWDLNVQRDRMAEAWSLDNVFVDKQAMEAKITNIAIQGDTLYLI